MKSKSWLRVLLGVLVVVVVAEFCYLGVRRRSLIDRSAAEIHTCPICGRDTEFWGYGRPLRPGVLCSQCGSLERHRLMYLYLQQKTNLFSEKLSVLHFSPELGLERVLRSKPNLRYITTNFLGPADLRLDLTDVKLPDSCFDVVLCSHVLEHIVQDRKAMGEIFRILKPGGWALILTPVSGKPDTDEDPTVEDPRERLKRYGQSDHVRNYGFEDFPKRLRETGLQVTLEDFATQLGEAAIERYGLTPKDTIYFVQKPCLSSP